MKTAKILLPLLLATVLVGCNDDDDDDIKANVAVNANANRVLRSGKTENPYQTDVNKVAWRMEIPSLRNGQNDLFVVHTVDGYGVNYSMEYDCSLKAARWTAYQWHSGNSGNAWNRRNWKNGATFNGYGGNGDPFQPDPLIPAGYRLNEKSYTGSGYQRGHMLASQDRVASKDMNGQTFYMSNMHPQIGAFNTQGIWYNLEGFIRDNYNKDSFRDTLYVVKGGTIAEGQYTTKVNAGNTLVVPTYFYMAILCKNSKAGAGGYKAIAFWMEHKPNTDKSFINYAVSIDKLEELTGIDFFCNLPDDIENVVESSMIPQLWNLK